MDDGVGRGDLDYLAALPNGVFDEHTDVVRSQNHPRILLAYGLTRRAARPWAETISPSVDSDSARSKARFTRYPVPIRTLAHVQSEGNGPVSPASGSAGGRQDETMSSDVNVRASRRAALAGKWSGGQSRACLRPSSAAELRQEHNAPSDIFPARREFTAGDIVSSQGREANNRYEKLTIF
jgi:hypothetical protein